MSASHSVRERISIHAPRAGGDDNGNNKTTPSSDFNPRPPCGGRRLRYCTQTAWKKFQSTPPVRGATPTPLVAALNCSIFQSTPPVRGATCRRVIDSRWAMWFQSTPPVRGATTRVSWRLQHWQAFQSTPPVRGATFLDNSRGTRSKISIHAPRAGGDVTGIVGSAGWLLFQSTPPVRGATKSAYRLDGAAGNFNPRPPCGGRQICSLFRASGLHFNPRPPCGGRPQRFARNVRGKNDFNPRPPCGGRPPRRRVRNGRCRGFQSTPPVRGATGRDFDILEIGKAISIHAPRAGGDLSAVMRATEDSDISIHAPRAGGDTSEIMAQLRKLGFQSTPPVRGATDNWRGGLTWVGEFQSTPPVRGATMLRKYGMDGGFVYFNPRPPCGGRL